MAVTKAMVAKLERLAADARRRPCPVCHRGDTSPGADPPADWSSLTDAERAELDAAFAALASGPPCGGCGRPTDAGRPDLTDDRLRRVEWLLHKAAGTYPAELAAAVLGHPCAELWPCRSCGVPLPHVDNSGDINVRWQPGMTWHPLRCLFETCPACGAAVPPPKHC